MSRSTVLPFRLSAGLLAAAAALTLSACGRDEPEQGAAPATPVASTPATTPATTPEAPADEPANTPAKEERDAAAEQPEASKDRDTVVKADASPRNKKPKTPTGKVAAALREAGFEVKPFGATGDATSSLQVGSDISVAFYPSAAVAKDAAEGFKEAFESSDAAHGEVELSGERLYLLTKPTELKKSDKADLKRVVKVAEAAL